MIDKDKLMKLVGDCAHTERERSLLYGMIGELEVSVGRIAVLEKCVQELMDNRVGTGPATVTKKKTAKKTVSKGGE